MKHRVVPADGTAAATERAEGSSVEEEPDLENCVGPSSCFYAPREALHWCRDWTAWIYCSSAFYSFFLTFSEFSNVL